MQAHSSTASGYAVAGSGLHSVDWCTFSDRDRENAANINSHLGVLHRQLGELDKAAEHHTVALKIRLDLYNHKFPQLLVEKKKVLIYNNVDILFIFISRWYNFLFVFTFIYLPARWKIISPAGSGFVLPSGPYSSRYSLNHLVIICFFFLYLLF